MSIHLFKRMAVVLTLAAATFAYTQNKAEEALTKFQENYPQEKIHLLFNKDHYVAGENLWFKSFVFEGYNRSNISTTLFVELYDSSKKLLDKKMIPLLKGEGSGSFSLASTLKEDVYFIRAYTTWMTNFSEDFNYLQPIAVYNPASTQKLVADTDKAWSATVHPESGTFVEGIDTKFAVRLHSSGSASSNWNGYVTDSENPDLPVAKFNGFDQNVGLFNLKPQAGKNYQLTVQDEKGKKISIDLPTAVSSGLHLQVESTEKAVKYTIKSKNISTENQPYKILGTINNTLVYKAIIHKLNDAQSASIPADKLINGVLRLTIFDNKENVVAERLCFVQPQTLHIKKPNLDTDLKSEERTKNLINIGKADDFEGYSVAVADAESSTSEEENSLLSSLWLTGDLSTRITKPAQYFVKDSNPQALDALLISEKWKRFEWFSIIAGNYPFIKNKPESYISYKGKVLAQGKPATNSELNLIFTMPDSGTKFHQIKTDASGLFTLNNLVFEDTMSFSYQLNSSDKAVAGSTQVYFQPAFSFVPLRKDLPNSLMMLTDRIQGEEIPAKVAKSVSTLTFDKFINEKITDIEEVKIKVDRKNKTNKLNEELSSPLFKSMNEMVFDFVNDNNMIGGNNILQWLQGRVPGLQISTNGPNTSATMRGGPVDIFLNEMRVDPSQISMISVPDVAMIKVIRGFFAASPGGGGNGAILIYTKRGGITGSVSDNGQSKSLKEMKLKGYDKEEPFNNTIYVNIDQKSLTKDTRSTLYWNPYLPKDTKESTTVQFYNNDDAKAYKVIIIGFDEQDNLLYYNEIVK
ncbi:hypothetical protein CHRY9390_02669 [Chryseobacterium aquaeductus]|uniref:TonB-dependent receptor plug domain-containing protein n=1 Tax=Chryseobacterium aquaeductus TaxID=2675056 RepID=A0A9N8MHN4_9FLAO|nr:hypothetical protein [Chryseobacterium aquaeductus]CAA7331951.1 hypothetical protein CHRY9390_02669 [Chryseobacterium potabilaquae]CAD7813522.1 hypothetical protein CHRY9390_02669 [Chryseobacterium aquaeductus]